MTDNIVDEFVNYWSARHFNAASLLSKLNSVSRRNGERTLKDLWEASDLSANDFADEVAQFYRLPRVALPQLIAAPALTAKFSRRFLRETLVFPYAAEDGRPRLVLADPTDAAAVRAAEIVLAAPVAVEVARAECDVRVATMPTQHGESAVIRLLPRDRGLLEIAKLGLSAHDEAILRRLLMLPHGMIVVTGPTGSGKTTTLATMMSILNESTRKILTIEDPVEYEIQGLNQSQVRPSIGLTFSNALRSFLRHDPDVIMVSEMRDAQTA